jgi:hypothetical protein
MVLPAAIAGEVDAAESASTDRATLDAIAERFQRERGNIRLSPDVKLVKDRRFVMHAARYLGALTCCKSWVFETCTKRVARQSGFGSSPGAATKWQHSPMFHFTNSSPIILVRLTSKPNAPFKAQNPRELP